MEINNSNLDDSPMLSKEFAEMITIDDVIENNKLKEQKEGVAASNLSTKPLTTEDSFSSIVYGNLLNSSDERAPGIETFNNHGLTFTYRKH